MGLYTVVSPLCTWLVASCLSAAGDGDCSPSLGRFRRRRSSGRASAAALYGSGIGSLVCTCLSFGPCEEFYRSLSVVTDRRQRRAAHCEKVMAIAMQPAKQVEEKRRTNMKQRRVAVTGMGVVTLLGHELDVFYNNLLEGISGISEIENFDCASYPMIDLLLCKFICHAII